MSAIDHLAFDQDTSYTQINEFLNSLKESPNHNFVIHPRVVAFASKKRKNTAISLSSDQDTRPDFEACDYLPQLGQNFINSGTLMWFSNLTGRIGNPDGKSWHNFICVFKDRELVIFDPNYESKPSEPRHTNGLKGLTLIRYFIPLIQNKGDKDPTCQVIPWGRKLERVLIGGGDAQGDKSSSIRSSAIWAKEFIDGGCKWEFGGWEEVIKPTPKR